LKTQNANAANQLLKSPYKTIRSSFEIPRRPRSDSRPAFDTMSRATGSLMSFFQSISADPGMWPRL